MAIDTTPSVVATNALQALPFSTLIGGPLDAAIRAQALAAKTSWEFIKEVGLNEVEKGKKEAVNVAFTYNKDGQMTKLIVPILTIVPIPYIAVETIDINFKANISASSSSTSEVTKSEKAEGEAKARVAFGFGPFSVSTEFKANYSSKKDSKASKDSRYSVEYTMDVGVHAGQSDMPAGLATVLNILQSSITDVHPNGQVSVYPKHPEVNVSDLEKDGIFNITITVTIKDPNGLFVEDKTIVAEAAVGNEVSFDKGLTATTNDKGEAVFNMSGKVNKDYNAATGYVAKITLKEKKPTDNIQDGGNDNGGNNKGGNDNGGDKKGNELGTFDITFKGTLPK